MIMKQGNKSKEKNDKKKSDPFLDEFLSTSEPVEKESFPSEKTESQDEKKSDPFLDESLSTSELIEKECAPSEKTELQEDALHCEFEGDIAIVRKVIKQLTTVYDPEIPVNIYDLGLIYKIKVNDDGLVFISMMWCNSYW